MRARILTGDALATLRTLPDESVQSCVTSPPYWGLRDYGHDDQMGLESTPEEYVAGMVAVFREVRRVLRDDGCLLLNAGDSYVGSRSGNQGESGQMANRSVAAARCRVRCETRDVEGLKPKDLVGIPWMLAFALRADGWWLRSDIIWHKPNPMPESVRDRPTKSHEYVFLLTKSARYFWDAKAISEAATHAGRVLDYTGEQKANTADESLQRTLPKGRVITVAETRNARTVWSIATTPFSGAHFAVMAPDLAEKCIRATSAPGDTVLDPFGGAGTTGLIAAMLGRDSVSIELNPENVKIAADRIRDRFGLLCTVEVAA